MHIKACVFVHLGRHGSGARRASHPVETFKHKDTQAGCLANADDRKSLLFEFG